MGMLEHGGAVYSCLQHTLAQLPPPPGALGFKRLRNDCSSDSVSFCLEAAEVQWVAVKHWGGVLIVWHLECSAVWRILLGPLWLAAPFV
ncbi:unnamed protein product [Arctogadus glacialis]